MGFKKWIIPEINKQIATELAEECNIEPFLALMAYSRGYTDPFSVDEFLSRDMLDLDPLTFPDMEKAAARIDKAVATGEKIVIYGDYDCDGVTATALLYTFLKTLDANVEYYIPSRHEGYGMNITAVERLADDGVKLIITVDNGISAIDEINKANELGMEVVVTDHHLPKDNLPSAVAVVDPHRKDCIMDFKDFAGVGVAFALAVAVSGKSPEVMLQQYADLVALGTVADVMPLKCENRSMVWVGVKKINKAPCTGLKALMAASGAKFGEISSGTLAFTAAPRINAAGRLGDAARAVKLLTEQSYAAAMEIAAELDDENKRRQKIEQDIAEAASKLVLKNKLYNNRVIVVAGDGWHEGVLGIAAARIAERFERPTILLSRDNPKEDYKGSARTVGEFSIFNAINACSELLIKFGGHDKAAGLTIASKKLNDFCNMINDWALNVELPVPTINIDCRLNPAAAVPDLVYTLKPLEPFGTNNPKPVFALLGMSLVSVNSIGNGKHIRLIAVKNNTTVAMVMFGKSKDAFPFRQGDVLDFAVTLELKEYQGEEQLSIFVKDVRPHGINDDEKIKDMELYDAYAGDRLTNEQAKTLCFDRNELALVYRAIKSGADTLCKLKIWVSDISDAKISVMVEVMEELGLIYTTGALDEQRIFLKESGKVELETSSILCKLSNSGDCE